MSPRKLGILALLALAHGGCSLLFEGNQSGDNDAAPTSQLDAGLGNDSSVADADVADRWTQSEYLKASNAGEGDQFGNQAIALSADGLTLVVGAIFEDGSGTSVNAPPDDDAIAAGAAYVFTHTNGAWAQEAYLKASTASSNDRFGQSVAMSDDGNTIAVGASKAPGLGGASDVGAVYVFRRNNNTWTQEAPLYAPDAGMNGRFGITVALSTDGETLAVGSDGNDERVYVFDRSQGDWNEIALIQAANADSNDNFGKALALSGNGQTVAVGAWGEDSSSTGINNDDGDSNLHTSAGAVYVFTRASSFADAVYIKASNTDIHDNFGYSVAP